MFHSRAGPSTVMDGSRQRTDTSMRTWSLPLAVQPWATTFAPVLVGHLHHLLGDQRPRQRGVQRILALVERVRLERREGEVPEELLLGVDDDRLDGAGRQRPLPQTLEVLHAAHVDQQRR